MNLVSFLYSRSKLLLIVSTVFASINGVGGGALVALIASGAGKRHDYGRLALEFFGLCIGLLVSRLISQVALLRLTSDATCEMRIDLSKRLLETPYATLHDLGKPGLLAILTKDVDAVVSAVQIAPRLLTDAVLVIACIGYLAWLSLPLFAMLLVIMIACLFLYTRAKRYPEKMFGEMRARLDDQFRNFRDLVEGARELQLNKARGQMFVEKAIEPDARAYRDTSVRAVTAFTAVTSVGDMIFYMVIGLMLFVVPMWMTLPAQVLATATFVLIFLIGPISGIVNAGPAVSTINVSFRSINQLYSALSAAAPVDKVADPFERSNQTLLQLRSVCLAHRSEEGGEAFLLGPLNLTVHKGEVLFVVGGNGGGKTTLAMLLLGLYTADSGTILMNGVALDDANSDHYRSRFSAIFHDFYLFDRLFGIDPKRLAERGDEYLARVGLRDKVSIIGDRYSTIELSAGQRKRLALVSSYLEDKPIYLFDEWAADQDPRFKRIFYTEILPELKARGKTVIVISHDDAYFHCADRIVKLDSGLIVEAQSASAA